MPEISSRSSDSSIFSYKDQLYPGGAAGGAPDFLPQFTNMKDKIRQLIISFRFIFPVLLFSVSDPLIHGSLSLYALTPGGQRTVRAIGRDPGSFCGIAKVNIEYPGQRCF